MVVDVVQFTVTASLDGDLEMKAVNWGVMILVG